MTDAALEEMAETPRYRPAGRFSVTGFGFYVYLLSDAILFSALFAMFAVLRGATNGGPSGLQLFSLPNVALETACLLTSSFICGLGMQAAETRNRGGVLAMLLAVFGLGAAFLCLEVREFAQMAHDGAGPNRSAFLSSFFALVGTHGLHIVAGLIWVGVLIARVALLGFSDRKSVV